MSVGHAIRTKVGSALSIGRPTRVLPPAVAMLMAVIGNRQLWGDEVNTVRLIVENDLLGVLLVSSHHAHPPTWYLLGWVLTWPALLGVSMLAFAATAHFTTLLGEEFYSYREGLLAGLLVALSPFLAEQAGWIRMYALLTAVLTAGLWLSVRGRWRHAAAAMLVGASLHVFGWFGPAYLALRTIRRWPKYALAVVGLGSLPTLYVLLVSQVPTNGFTRGTTHVSHATAPEFVDIALAAVLPLTGISGPPLFILVIPTVLLGAFYIDADGWLAAWIALPIIGIAAASYIFYPIWGFKYLGFIAPAIAVAAVNPNREPLHRLVIWCGLGLLFLWGWVVHLNGGYVARRLWLWPALIP